MKWEIQRQSTGSPQVDRELQRVDNQSSRLAAAATPVGGWQGWPDQLDVPAGGWLRADGSEIQASQYPALYAVYRNAFGGRPGETFVIPAVANTIILAKTVL